MVTDFFVGDCEAYDGVMSCSTIEPWSDTLGFSAEFWDRTDWFRDALRGFFMIDSCDFLTDDLGVCLFAWRVA